MRKNNIWDKLGVTFIDKMREPILRWFGHVKSRCTDIPTRMCERLTMDDHMRLQVGQRSITEK